MSQGHDDHSEALKLFKDWNDKLLVITVAALAWVVRDGLPSFFSYTGVSAFMLAASIGFGICTLALLTLIQEQFIGRKAAEKKGQLDIYIPSSRCIGLKRELVVVARD